MVPPNQKMVCRFSVSHDIIRTEVLKTIFVIQLEFSGTSLYIRARPVWIGIAKVVLFTTSSYQVTWMAPFVGPHT